MPIVIAAAIFIAAMTASGFWKYAQGGYTGLDLAILHQTFWNTAAGRWFELSVHPHSYLGDHAELLIAALAQVYRFWQDPRMLLVLQAAALAVPAWPIYLIAKRRLAGAPGLPSWTPLVLALLWFLNPSVQSIGFFEFHILPFALIPLFFAALEYDRDRLGPFLAWCAAAAVVREDAGLAVAGFAALALLEKRPWRWVLAPAALAAAGFLALTSVAAAHAPDGAYKFSLYYSWIFGSSPLAILAHLFSWTNFEMLVGFLLPLLFLPLLAPKRLILAVVPLSQIILTSGGGGAIILQTHYATLFLVAVFLAGIDGIRETPALLARLARRGLKFPAAAPLVLVVFASAYAAAAYGPFPGVAAGLLRPERAAQERAWLESILPRIPPDASVASSYRPLALLSGRRELYSLHYHCLGLTQFGRAPYAVPDSVRYVLLDRRDLAVWQIQYRRVAWAASGLENCPERLQTLLTGSSLIATSGPYSLFDRATVSETTVSETWVSETKVPETKRARYGLDGMLSPTLLYDGR